jgi:hypothetical protein
MERRGKRKERNDDKRIRGGTSKGRTRKGMWKKERMKKVERVWEAARIGILNEKRKAG